MMRTVKQFLLKRESNLVEKFNNDYLMLDSIKAGNQETSSLTQNNSGWKSCGTITLNIRSTILLIRKLILD
jgi:hypothetical protein